MATTWEYDRADAPAGALRLHLNEHTGGCSPRVMAAIAQVRAQDVAQYQDYEPLHEAVAARFGVTRASLLLVNGLDEGLLAAAVAYLRDDHREAIVLEPAFGMYADVVEAVGGTLVRVAPEADFSLDLEAVRAAVTPRTGLLFVTSPGNPTGVSLTRQQIDALAALLPPHALLLVDEAYAEFADQPYLRVGEAGASREELPANIVVGRTFAKAYGLAGLRAGAVIGAPATIARIRRVVPPYSLNAFVVAALTAALDDTAYTTDYLHQVRASKALLYDACERLGLGYVPSDANFVLVRAGEHRLALIRGLEARNIYVRDRDSQPGCAGCVRITTGLVAHTQQCIAAMEEILCARG